MTEKGDYEVGRNRPPKSHQFKKGQSGNPNGRRRATSFDKMEIIERVFNETVKMTIDGKSRRVTKVEAAIRMTLQVAMQKGDLRACERVLQLLEGMGGDWRQRWAAEAEAGAQEVMAKIHRAIEHGMHDPDPREVEDYQKRQFEEIRHVMACARCSPFLRKRWDEETVERAFRTSIRKLYEQYEWSSSPAPALPPPSPPKGASD